MNLGEFVDLCQVALGDESATTTSQIKWGLVRSIDKYKTQRFSWNRIKWELTCTASENFYTSLDQVDSGTTYTAKQIFSLDSAFHVLDGRHYELAIVPFETIGYGNSETTHEGRPWGFAVGAQEFLVLPVPDDAYVLQGVAVADVNQAFDDYDVIDIDAADEATSPWLDNADKMMQSSTLYEVFTYYRRDPKWAAVYQADANQEFQRHVQDFERREGAGRVRGYWNHRDYPSSYKYW